MGTMYTLFIYYARLTKDVTVFTNFNVKHNLEYHYTIILFLAENLEVWFVMEYKIQVVLASAVYHHINLCQGHRGKYKLLHNLWRWKQMDLLEDLGLIDFHKMDYLVAYG